jgi:hypothetical protein
VRVKPVDVLPAKDGLNRLGNGRLRLGVPRLARLDGADVHQLAPVPPVGGHLSQEAANVHGDIMPRGKAILKGD